MFAIIEDGNRQYRVQEGDTLTVDFRADSEAGQSLTFDRVLLANGGADSVIGQPTIDGASVEAEIIVPLHKGPKLEVQKLRHRKNSRRHTGHRQKHTTVRITGISVPGLQINEVSESSDTAAEE
jgi:large subunit ribosomal protein L21